MGQCCSRDKNVSSEDFSNEDFSYHAGRPNPKWARSVYVENNTTHGYIIPKS